MMALMARLSRHVFHSRCRQIWRGHPLVTVKSTHTHVVPLSGSTCLFDNQICQALLLGTTRRSLLSMMRNRGREVGGGGGAVGGWRAWRVSQEGVQEEYAGRRRRKEVQEGTTV